MNSWGSNPCLRPIEDLPALRPHNRKGVSPSFIVVVSMSNRPNPKSFVYTTIDFILNHSGCGSGVSDFGKMLRKVSKLSSLDREDLCCWMRSFLITHLDKRVADLVQNNHLSGSGNQIMPSLRKLLHFWSAYSSAVKAINGIFLEAKYAKANRFRLLLFRDKVLLVLEIKALIHKSLIFLIEEHFSGRTLNSDLRDLFTQLDQMLTDLDYSDKIMADTLKDAKLLHLFRFRSNEVFLQPPDRALSHSKLVKKMLDATADWPLGAVARRRLVQTMERIMIWDPVCQITRQVVNLWRRKVSPKLMEKLQLLAKELCSTAAGQQSLVDALFQLWQLNIRALRKKTRGPDDPAYALGYVQKLIDYGGKVHLVDVLCQTPDSLLKKLANSDGRSVEYMAQFVDAQLRKSPSSIVHIFLVCLTLTQLDPEDQRIFSRLYIEHLTRRLLRLDRKSGDLSMEKLMSQNLHFLGRHFTQQLDAMIADFEDAEKSHRGFHICFHNIIAKNDELQLTVLSLKTFNWPPLQAASNQTPIRLPTKVADMWDKYITWHALIWPSRILTLYPGAGRAEMQGLFGQDRKCDLVVTTYQMCILMLFNDHDSLTFAQIKAKTRIPEEELVTALQPLTSGTNLNSRLLLKESGAGVGQEDLFLVNDHFGAKCAGRKRSSSSPFVFDTLPLVAPLQEDTKPKLERGNPDLERQWEIQACIVKILKRSRVLPQNSLMAQVQKKLEPRMTASPNEVIQGIESLISKEYIRPQGGTRKALVYVP